MSSSDGSGYPKLIREIGWVQLVQRFFPPNNFAILFDDFMKIRRTFGALKFKKSSNIQIWQNNIEKMKLKLHSSHYSITSEYKQYNKKKAFNRKLQTTMYDFHDFTDIFVNPSFLPFCTQKAPLKAGILVPKVAYDLPEFKIRPWELRTCLLYTSPSPRD